MKRAERDEWVAALRSGEYTQGRHNLNRDGKQCCLGVKCILDVQAGRNEIIGRHTQIEQGYVSYRHKTDAFSAGVSSFPTTAILKAWGLSEDQASMLAAMNDGGENFEEIAVWIEENVEVEE